MLFLELPIINLQTKIINTEMLFKLSNLNSSLALTLGYLNPDFNNSALLKENFKSRNSCLSLQNTDWGRKLNIVLVECIS